MGDGVTTRRRATEGGREVTRSTGSFDEPVTTMYVAATPSAGRVLLTCLGGYLSAGGAGSVNHYWDRDLDAQMARTANRPIPAGRISPRAALVFGVVNSFIKPIVQIISIPLYILTLGLIHVVINAFMLWITAWITEHTTHWGLYIEHFWWTAIWAAILLSIVSWLLSLIVRDVSGTRRK